MKKSVIRIISFLVILITVLYYVDMVFAKKNGDGIYDFTKFYQLEDNTVDVLVLGSSHAFEAVNTGLLWKEHGISSFILGGSYQPLWNTYYYLKEALKTQKPRLIVLEAYMVSNALDYHPDITSNTYGMKWSQNRLDAIKVSSPKEKWPELFLSYTQYHSRYTNLSRADFVKNQGNPLYENWKGFGCNMKTTPFETPNISTITEKTPLPEKSEEYYRKIIELTLEENIPLLIVISPYAGISGATQAQYNTAADIASKYNISFINYNLLYDEIGLDFSCDVADPDHLNYIGSQKYTHVLGKYIVNNYSIPDHRGDDKYASWEADSQYIFSMIKNQQLLEASDLSGIIQHINDQEYLLFVSVDGNCNTSDLNMAVLFDSLGIPQNQGTEIWYINNKTGILYTSITESSKQTFRLNYHDICLSRTFDESLQENVNSIVIDRIKYQKVTNGINITVYNPVTQSIVDSFGFDMDNNYNLVR